MTKKKPRETKQDTLRTGNTLHPRPENVTDEIFLSSDFFDPRDLVQVKYEMLRRVRVDALPVSRAARAFGLSRPSFYKAQKDFDERGLRGLLPARKGPRRSHKLSTEVMDFVARKRGEDPRLRVHELVDLIQTEFGITVHPRSIERAIQRAQKKTPSSREHGAGDRSPDRSA